jgi:hypothetical protein
MRSFLRQPASTLLIVSALSISACATHRNQSTDTEQSAVPPKLTEVKTKRIWIPDKIEGERFEEGHWLYIIDKPVSWSK